MDTSSDQIELEEGEIDELEDGEIEDDESNETELKTVSKVTPSSSVDSDFSRHGQTFQDEKQPHFSPTMPQHARRRENNIPSPRYNNNENWNKRQQHERAFNEHNFPVIYGQKPPIPWNIRGPTRSKQRPILQATPPRLPTPKMHNRAKPFFSQPRPRSPSPAKTPDKDASDDFDLLLERHKQIQLQLENLEREESAALLDNEDLIDDSFIDIPVNNDNKNTQGQFGEGTSGIDSNTLNKEKPLPDKFSPFKIKPLRPPIPTLKELSEKQKSKDNIITENLTDSTMTTSDIPSTSDDGVSKDLSTSDNSQLRTNTAKKRSRRRIRKRKQRGNKKPTAVLTKTVAGDKPESAKLMEPTTEIEAKLMQLATSSANNEMNMKIRNNAEQQKKRRERLKQWQMSRAESILKKSQRSPSLRSGSESKDFEKDDYLEAPMDVESDTPDGPALPLIEETGDDPPPPPPPGEEEYLSLLQHQQQMVYGSYPVCATHINPNKVVHNMHGFYPPGQIMFNDWQSTYPTQPVEKASLPNTITSTNSPLLSDPQKSTEEEEEDDDDEADALREILLKSVIKKRAAKTTDKKTSDSAPVSPQQASMKTLEPPSKNVSVRRETKQRHQQQQMPLMPPQHEPVVIQLGQDSDTDESDSEEYRSSRERTGFFGSLDMMIKQARQSAVENSKPKQSKQPQSSAEMPKVPKTPDALSHLPEARQAEYKRLKQQLALHEGRKRQPLSDISQDKDAKSDGVVTDDKTKSEESGEVLELQQKVKAHEDRLAKMRNLLSEDQNKLTKMTSLLSDKTTLLEEQEAKVDKIKKQLEANQKAMLNNRVIIKKLHERAIVVKDRVSKRMTLSRNIEEELLRLKSMVSAVRKNPGLYKNSENKEASQTSTATQKKAEQKQTQDRQGLKRSVEDMEIMNTKKAKVEPPRSQSAKASPRKQAIAEIIAQEKARLKALEQELAKKLSQYNKTPNNNTSTQLTTRDSPAKNDNINSTSNIDHEKGLNLKDDGVESMEADGGSESKEDGDNGEQQDVVMLDFDVDSKQMDYIKTLQNEKEKKGPVFPILSTETPQPVHKKVAKCIWLYPKNTTPLLTDVQASNVDWLASTDAEVTTKKDRGSTLESSVPVGLYGSILLYFKSYRLSPYFRTKSGLSLRTLSHTNKINPTIPLCKYELKGTCNDEQCQFQHQRDYTPSSDDTLTDLAAYIVTNKEASTDAAETRIRKLVEQFVRQYKDKVSMDELYVLLVNHVRVNSGVSQPFYVSGANHLSLVPKKKSLEVENGDGVADSGGGKDRGRGVWFKNKEEKTKGDAYSNYGNRECQEVRYFNEVYNCIATLTKALEETPTDVELWIKLARLQMAQTNDDDGENGEVGVMQSLNTLSRGLEENPKSEELWLEYLKLFFSQGNPDEHTELCEQAISFTPSYTIWWHYLNAMDTYSDKKAICLRLINHLVSLDESTDIHSHRILEAFFYLIQLELYTGRLKSALLTFIHAIGKKKPTSQTTHSEIPKICDQLSPHDLTIVWLGYIHVYEFHRLPNVWFDQNYGCPSRMVAKEPFVFPWLPCGGTTGSSEKLLALFHEALSSCTHKDKSLSKVALCLPLYQNLLALERAHGRVDSAKGICRRLLQNNSTIVALWQCLAALEEATGNKSQALDVLQQGLSKCHHDCELAYTIARLHLEQKEPSKAVDILVSNTKAKYLKSDTSSHIDPIMLYRRLLNQQLPYDLQQLKLVDNRKPSRKDELYLWLSYCLLLELTPDISPLCLQYNLSAESAYETAVHNIPDVKNAQMVWLEYLFYKKSKLLESNTGLPAQEVLKSLNDIINRCLVSVSASRSLPFTTCEVWQDYSFHNQVLNLYLGCLPQSLWSRVFGKYRRMLPGNVQLTVRVCEHEAKAGSIDRAVKIAAIFLADSPQCITMWKIIIALNLQRNHMKEAHKLYQQSTEVLPFAATLWKDFIMFEMVHGSDKSSISAIINQCDKSGVDIQDYLKTLLGK